MTSAPGTLRTGVQPAAGEAGKAATLDRLPSPQMASLDYTALISTSENDEAHPYEVIRRADDTDAYDSWVTFCDADRYPASVILFEGSEGSGSPTPSEHRRPSDAEEPPPASVVLFDDMEDDSVTSAEPRPGNAGEPTAPGNGTDNRGEATAATGTTDDESSGGRQEGVAATPEGKTTTPEVESTIPKKTDATTPEDATTTPEDESTVPEDNAKTPEDETGTPEVETRTPEDETTTPNEVIF